MVITALAVAPAFIQQAKRDREEEMIHRGTEYARAIKKYYKKFGRYPANLEQLDNTNQIRFLRQRYKDPLTKNGKWKLLNYGDIQTLLNPNAPGTPAAALGSQGQGTSGQPTTSLGSDPNVTDVDLGPDAVGRLVGELAVHRESFSRVWSGSPAALECILDALITIGAENKPQALEFQLFDSRESARGLSLQ